MSVAARLWDLSNPERKLVVITVVIVLVILWSDAARVLGQTLEIIALLSASFTTHVQRRSTATSSIFACSAGTLPTG